MHIFALICINSIAQASFSRYHEIMIEKLLNNIIATIEDETGADFEYYKEVPISNAQFSLTNQDTGETYATVIYDYKLEADVIHYDLKVWNEVQGYIYSEEGTMDKDKNLLGYTMINYRDEEMTEPYKYTYAKYRYNEYGYLTSVDMEAKETPDSPSHTHKTTFWDLANSVTVNYDWLTGEIETTVYY